MKCLLALLLALAVCASSIVQAAQAKPGAVGKAKAECKPGAKGKLAKAPVDYEGEAVSFTEWKAVSDFTDEIALRHDFAREELGALFSCALSRWRCSWSSPPRVARQRT